MKVMIKKIFFLFAFIPFLLTAQVNDDFSDGDFTQNPSWFGDMEKFIINDNYQLQLNDNEAGGSYLVTENSKIHDTQWEFWVRIAYTPSDNNHPKIYLVSDSENLESELNGYYLQIGKTGTDNKRLYFFRQDGNEITELMESNQNIVAGNNNILRIKVIRDDAGNWEFWADQHGGELFLPQGSVNDNYHTSTQWLGIFCKYTVSNSDRIYFDDIYVGEVIPDTNLPEVVRLNVVDPNTLDVHFSKAVEVESAENTGNYDVGKDVGLPLIASRNPEYPNIVRLMFDQNFSHNILYSISIKDVKDLTGNSMKSYTSEFVNFNPKRYDVVFNELMVNPTPEVHLPPHEFIELYNTTEFEIDVEGWMLHDRTSQREIPYATIPPNSYLVLTTEDGYDEMAEYGNVISLPGFTSASVTHGGTELILYDKTGYIISSVYYSDKWYHDLSKKDGGWSLEKIDPYNFCGREDNWHASKSHKGGTPGEPNSIMGQNPDTVSPDLVRAGFIAKDTIILFFSEPMNEYSLMDSNDFNVLSENHDIGHPVYIEPVPPVFQQLKLALPEEMQENVIYSIEVDTTLIDCAGNLLNKNVARVAVSQPADSFDVVINEILFNPPESASQRYIELYNRSGKVIDLKNYVIASKDTINNYLENVRDISNDSYLFFPGEYVVLTTSPADVKEHYMTNNPEGFIKLNSLPRMTNSGGVAVFANKSFEIIDKVTYTEDMQYAMLYDNSGVALERLNYHRPSASKSNWHSASETSGFGTPGYKNSQFTYDIDNFEDEISLYPDIFSPNNDGYDDVLNIHFKLDKPGFVVNISVYDSRGRYTKTIAQNKLLGTDDVVIWDGTTDYDQKANIGIYIIFIELFDLDGNVRKYKKSTVLADRF